MTSLTQRDILVFQKFNKTFSRFDLIVRYAFLESYYNKTKKEYYYCRDLYLKMQKNRTGTIFRKDGKRYDEEFIKISDSFQQNGYIKKYPLIVNEDKHLINSSHRAACSLFFEVENTPYIVTKDWKSHLESENPHKQTYFCYDKKWFKENNFTDSELKFLSKKRDEIFLKNNLHFILILWPPVECYFKDIEEDIRQNHTILKSFECNFNSREDLNNFINKVYEIDDIQTWKVQRKIDFISKVKKTDIKVIYLDLFDTKYRTKNVDAKKNIAIEAEKIKKTIREKYKTKIDDYYYDIIIHVGDNYNHTDHIKKVLKESSPSV